jgi:acetyl-CoA synthetase
MNRKPIHKEGTDLAAWANMPDYDTARRTFSWHAARQLLDGLPQGKGLNIAHEAVDRHAGGWRADKVALRFLDQSLATTDISFRQLRALTNRFANLLRSLGVGKEDRVFTLTGRIPALYITALGALKNRSVFCPLFSAFGPEPIRQRLERGDARVLVTTGALFDGKVAKLLDSLPQLQYVILVDAHDSERRSAQLLDFDEALAGASEQFDIEPTDPQDMALIHFTSGTTGPPKAAVHVHESVVAHLATGITALDLHPHDVLWCTADPGWVTGTSYGIIAPLACGVTSIIDTGTFDGERWYRVLEAERVTVWYTGPTALRMLMRSGANARRQFDLSALRFAASVGEALTPEAVVWGERALGQPIHDNWWQTETGGIMIANFASVDIRPGSMGRPVPGVEAAILACGEDGRAEVSDGQVTVIDGMDRVGELALRPGWPSMFRAYLHDQDSYDACFAGGWYLTGDLACRDADGYFWFVGRADDVIKSAGHLISPFEVESTLMEHPAVVEVGVIGRPDPVAGEIVKAFVAVAPGHAADDQLRLELIGWGRSRLGAVLAPKEIVFEQDLPKTNSGKIMHRLLRARELGIPEGSPDEL